MGNKVKKEITHKHAIRIYKTTVRETMAFVNILRIIVIFAFLTSEGNIFKQLLSAVLFIALMIPNRDNVRKSVRKNILDHYIVRR